MQILARVLGLGFSSLIECVLRRYQCKELLGVQVPRMYASSSVPSRCVRVCAAHTHTHAYIYMYVCMYVCMYVGIYIYIYI